ncbi:MAG: hypothetical protein V7776_02835 [Halopseudomonas aestusnigri]
MIAQQLAIENNVSWCDLVFRTNDQETDFYPQYWINRGAPLPYYPDLITRAPSLSFQTYDAIKKLPVGSYIKDSFATLDLTTLGYDKLFKNTWLTWCPKSNEQIGSDHSPDNSIEVIKSPKHLTKWMTAWEPEGKTASQIFHPKLLLNSDIKFVAVTVEDKIIAGAVFNMGPVGVLGISNVFGNKNNQLKIISFTIRSYTEHTIVTYENDNEIATYQELGFVTTGALAVWQCKREAPKSQI